MKRRNLGCVFSYVLEEGLEPSSLAACDFESHVYTIPPLQPVFFCSALRSVAENGKVINRLILGCVRISRQGRYEACGGNSYLFFVMAFQNDSIYWVEVEKIVPNPFQPRREFDEQKLAELADSVRMYGILQPLTVTRNEIQREDGTFYTEYELIAGERRLRASKLAGLSQVPVIIREGEDSEQEKLELAIIENLQREDLNAVDRALAFKQLATLFELSHAQVAKKVGRSREYVSNSIRLLALPDYMLRSLRLGEMSEGHSRTLLMLNDRPEEQDVVFREILLKKLSVREVERIVRKIATDKVRKKNPMDFDVELIEIEKQFMETLGTRVSILKTDFGGKVTIDYFEVRDLEEILARMKPELTQAVPDRSSEFAALVTNTLLEEVTPVSTPDLPALIAELARTEALRTAAELGAEYAQLEAEVPYRESESVVPDGMARSAEEILQGLDTYVEEGRFEDLMNVSDQTLMTTESIAEIIALEQNLTPEVPRGSLGMARTYSLVPRFQSTRTLYQPSMPEQFLAAEEEYAPVMEPAVFVTSSDEIINIPDVPSDAMFEELADSLTKPILDLDLEAKRAAEAEAAIMPVKEDDDSDLYAIRHFSV